MGVNGAIQSHPRTDITRRIPTYPGGPLFYHDSDGVQDVQMTDLFGAPWYLCRLKGADPGRRFVESDADVRRSAILTPLQFDPGLFPNYAPWHALALEPDLLAGRYGLAGWDGMGYDSSINAPRDLDWWDNLDWDSGWTYLAIWGLATAAAIGVAAIVVTGGLATPVVAYVGIGLVSLGTAAWGYGTWSQHNPQSDYALQGDTARFTAAAGKTVAAFGGGMLVAPLLAPAAGIPYLGAGLKLAGAGLLTVEGRSLYNTDWSQMDWIDVLDRVGPIAGGIIGGGIGGRSYLRLHGSRLASNRINVRYEEYMRYRSQGYSAKGAFRLMREYSGEGQHFIYKSVIKDWIRRVGKDSVRGKLLAWYRDSPLNLVKGRHMSTGQFYEYHARLHAKGLFGLRPKTATVMPMPGKEVWCAANLPTFQPRGHLGYLWHGSPTALKVAAGSGLAAVGAGIYYLTSE